MDTVLILVPIMGLTHGYAVMIAASTIFRHHDSASCLVGCSSVLDRTRRELGTAVLFVLLTFYRRALLNHITPSLSLASCLFGVAVFIMTSKIELAMAVANPGAKIQSMANEMVDLESGEEEKEDEGPCGSRTLATRVAQGVAGASIIVNIVAIAIEQSGVMIVAGIIALIIGAIVIQQQFNLQDVGCKCRIKVFEWISANWPL